MANKVAETKITTDSSGNQIRYSNPAVHNLPSGAGVAVTAAVKTVGNPNGVVHGQVSGTSVIHNNPA